RPRLPRSSARGRFDHTNHPLVAQMLEPIGDRILFNAGADFIHETLMGKGVLQTQGRTQGSGKERRNYGVGEHALTGDSARAAAFAADAAGDIGRHQVVAIAQFAGGLGSALGDDVLRLETREHTGNHVAGVVVAGAAAERSGPGLTIPGSDASLPVQGGALVNDARLPVVFAPRHLIFTRELDTDRAAHRLGEQGGIVGNGIGAVEPIAGGATSKDDANIVWRQPEQRGYATAGRIDGLSRRPDGGLIALHIGHGAGGADGTVHLVGIGIGGTQDSGRTGQLFLYIL